MGRDPGVPLRLQALFPRASHAGGGSQQPFDRKPNSIQDFHTSPGRTGPDTTGAGGYEVMGSALTMREVEAVELETEVINSAELAKRLGVPESWVRSRSNPKRTSDPIPHYKLGRYINFPWGSSVLREWLDRQLVGANRNRSGRRTE